MVNGLFHDAAERAVRYLMAVDERSVGPTSEALARLAQFNEALPNGQTDPHTVLALLDDIGSPATTATAGGRYFGFVVGGTLPVTIAANWLATAWDQNAGAEVISPTASRLEQVALRWLLELFGLPPSCSVGFVTGGTMANFTALAAARHHVLERAGWDVERDGLFGAPPVTVVLGEEVHVAVYRALGLLGLGRSRVVHVPADDQGRMRADAFPRDLSGPLIVCVQAGNVNSGAFDPIGDICALAHDRGAWVHVDGAFGLWAVAAPARAHLVSGLAQADSWATDAHKWLNVPHDSGVCFVRHADAHRAAMALQAAYLPQPDIQRRDPAWFTPEMSRRARGVEVWAALRTLGRSGVADLIETCCQHAARFAAGLHAAGYEVLNDVVLNQVLISFGAAEKTNRVIARIQQEGTCWCGGTVWRGQTAMRISVSSWATTEADVERSLEAIIHAAESD